MSAVKNAEGTQKLSVFKMTWPIFIEILLQMMVGNVDQFMLSHYSQHSVAAVGNANQIINIVILALSVISMAATILIAQHRGAGNREKVAEVCTVALLANMVFGVIISAALFIFDGFFLSLLDVPADIWAEALLFLRYIGLFYCSTVCLYLFYFVLPRLFPFKNHHDYLRSDEPYQYRGQLHFNSRPGADTVAGCFGRNHIHQHQQGTGAAFNFILLPQIY